MKCPECDNEMVMFVSVRVKLPAALANNFTKKELSKKHCKLMSADWDKARAACHKCGYSEVGL